MKIEIKNLRRGQMIYDEDLEDRYKVYSEPEFKNGKWQVEVTTSGDYEWIFYEGDNLWDSPDRKD